MSSGSSSQQYVVDRLLDRVSRSYPNGIPLSVLTRVEMQMQSDMASLKKVLFLIASSSAGLTSDEQQLLTSIVSKGLGLAEDEIGVAVYSIVDQGDEIDTWCNAVRKACAAHVVVSMGFQHAPHGTWSGEAPAQLHTVSLAEVLLSKDAKRLFWGHLQGVIERLKST